MRLAGARLVVYGVGHMLLSKRKEMVFDHGEGLICRVLVIVDVVTYHIVASGVCNNRNIANDIVEVISASSVIGVVDAIPGKDEFDSFDSW